MRKILTYPILFILAFLFSNAKLYAQPGNALRVTGTQYVTVPAKSTRIADNFTVMAWVMPTSTSGAMHIFSTRETAECSFDMQVVDGNRLHADIGNGSDFITTAADAAFKYTSNQWLHVAYTVSPTGYKIYANGIEVGAGTLSGGPLLLDATHKIVIGKNGTENTYFKGNIDEVKVYNATLTAADVKAEMLNTSSALPAQLLAYYNFEQSGSILNDLSGNGYDGTVTGAGSSWVESYAMVMAEGPTTTGIGPNEFTVNWASAVNGTVDNYLLEVSPKSDFTEPLIGSPFIVTGTSKMVSAMSGITYYCRVKPDKASVSGQGAWSETATATTVATYDKLSALILSEGTLSQPFSENQLSYTTIVSTSSVQLVARQNNPAALIEMDINAGGFQGLTSGSQNVVPLNIGTNIIKIKVSDGSASRVYTLTVSRVVAIKRFVKPVATGTKDGLSWQNASDDLQLMINNSIAFDSVFVAAGTYQPNRQPEDLNVITIKDRLNSFLLKADVMVYGGFTGIETRLADRDLTQMANKSILSGDFNNDDVRVGAKGTFDILNRGDNAYHVVFSMGEVGHALLDGFTITGGCGDYGIYRTINGIQFVNSDAGGMVLKSSSPELRNLSIIGNYGDMGGGMNIENSQPIMDNLVISWNKTKNFGAGIQSINSSFTLTNSTVSDNAAISAPGGGSGGAVYIRVGNPVFKHVLMTRNFSSQYGGAISAESSSLIIINSILSENESLRFGGGIACRELSSPKLINVSIINNRSERGGGLFISQIPVVLTNVTVAGNYASLRGGAMENFFTNDVVIRNSIIWGNSGPEAKIYNRTSSPTISYSLLQEAAPGTGNLSVDPLFRDVLKGDYRIQLGSPAINAGSNTFFNSGQSPDLSALITDVKGNPRKADGTIDMGAYETQMLSAALNFDGVDDKVTFAAPAATVSGSFTVQAWVRPTDVSKTMHVLSTKSTGGYGFDIQLKNGNTIHSNIGSSGGWLSNAADATFDYSTGRWMHIAYTVSPTGYQIYINGELAGNGAFSGTPLLMDANHILQLGNNGTENTYFKGDLDEVRIYNKAMTQANIQADMVSSYPPMYSDLVAWFDFDEGQVQGNNIGIVTLKDKSAKAYDGTLNSFASTGVTSNWVESYAMVVPGTAPVLSLSESSFEAKWLSPEIGKVDNGYVLQMATDANFTMPVIGSPFTVSGTSHTFTGLTLGTNYYYRVSADKLSVTGTGAYSKTMMATMQSYTPPGNALNFDGSKDYVSVPPQARVVSGNFTVMAWVRPTNATKTMHILSTRESGDSSFDIQLVGGNKIHADIGTGSAWLTNTADANYKYEANHWLHVAYVVTPAICRIYANGAEVGAARVNGNPLLLDATHYLTIGKSSTESTFFQGDMDEIKIYSSALSALDVQTDMLNTNPVQPSTLVAHYNFDQGVTSQSTVLTDQGTFGYNGTLSDFSLTGQQSNWVESYAMVLPVPTSLSGVSDTEFTANWTAPVLGTVDNYILDVATDNSFASPVIGSPFNVTGLSKTITGLSQSDSYYYRLRADMNSLTGHGAYTPTTTVALINANLSALLLSEGMLSPGFSSAVLSYTTVVPFATTSLTITPTAAFVNSVIELSINGGLPQVVASGAVSGPLSLNLGSNTIIVKVTDELGITVKEYTFAVTRALEGQVIIFAALVAKNLGDADFNLTATGGGSGNPVTYTSSDHTVATINGNTVTIIGVGTTTIKASQAGNAAYNPASNVSRLLTVGKGTATLSLSNLTAIYDGTQKSAIVTTNPIGLSGVSITYDGSTIAPIAVGTYAVVASLNNADYTAADVTGSLVIGKGTATLSLSNVTATYDGTAKSATATTNPAGLSGVSITYNGSTTLPIAAGTYVVVASLTNANYTAADVTAGLVIGKGTAALTLSGLTHTYDGTAKSATVTTNPAGLSGVSITYDGSTTLPTAAGTYAVVASLTNANYTAADVTGSLVIGKGTATLTLGNLSQAYDGSAKSATVTTNPVGLSGVSITYDGSTTIPTAVGTYAVVASLTNADYTAADATGSLVIGKGTATLALSNLSQTYDGTAKSATVTTNPVGLSGVSITYDGSATLPTAAGTYAVIASLNNTNYTATNATGSLVIGKGTAILTLSNLTQTYDGTGKSATVTTNPVGLSGVSITYDGSATLPTATGTYAVVASLTNANYTAIDATGSLVIGKGTATLTLSGLTAVYDGTAKSATVITNPVGLSGVSITYDGSATLPIVAGTYAVVASLTNANYTAIDATGSLVISKGTATLNLSGLTATYDGTAKSATVTTNPVGLSGVSITYDGSATLPTAAGTYAVVASLTNANYTAVNATGSLVIGKGTATLTLSNLSQAYDGTAKSATVTTSPAGLSGVSITYDGSATLPTATGTYAVVASLTNANYTAADVTGSLVIGKGTATLTLSGLTATYDGTGKSATVTTNPAGLSGVSITYDGSATLPTVAGTYAVVASLTNANYTATDATGSLVIGKGTAILTLSNLTQTYDGTGKSATVTTNPVGLTGVSITYDGLATLPTAAGTYAVVASLSNANYTAADATGSLVIGKGTATLTLSGLTATYDGTAKSATVTTNPVGLSGVSITYDGLATLPSAAGTYAVVASLTNANYTAADATGSLVIGKGTATLTLSNLTQIYDGIGKSATVTTNPVGLSGVSITYDGSATLPTTAGTYAVVASLTNANYTAADATGSLVIGKGTATLALSNLTQAYDGTGKSATATTNPVGLSGVSITYDGSATLPIAAGTYAVVASLTNANYTAADATGSLVIGKGTATLALSNLTQTYDGTGKSATVTTNPVGLSGVSITYDGLATLPSAAGTYAVVASLTNANYTAADATGSLVIGKGTATLTLSNLTQTYDGTGKSATVTTNPVGLTGVSITYDGLATLPTAAGTYAVVASLSNANYTAADATGSLVIGKGTATLTLSGLTATYDGTAKSATVTTNPVGLSGVSITYDGSATLPTVAGTYAVVASLTNANYTAADATGSLVIGKGTATLALSNLSQTYDGTAKSATVTTNPAGLSGVSMTYDGSATLPTAAGTYAVVASLTNANYTAVDATGSLVIGKGTATLALSNLTQAYDGTAKSATVTTNPVGLSGVSITYDGSVVLPTAAGTYAVIASLNNTNYTGADVTGTLVIGKGTAMLALSNLTATYDGTAKSATATTNPAGLSGVSITYDGSAILPTAVGTYAVVASLSNANYTALDATGSLVIGKGTATLALSNLTATYDGTAKSAIVTTNPVGLSGVSITYDGSATLPTAAGTYAVVASLTNANYTAADATGSLVIGKGTATLALSNLTQAYDGTAKSATPTTNPVGLSGVSITYDGLATLPTAAGTYAVVASLSNANYTAADATGSLVIGKGTATLTLSGLTATYDGTAKSATATTNPAGLSGVSITYDGSSTLPTAAGTYAVVASLSNANYTAADATGSLVIGKGTAILTLSNLTQTYDGTGKSATVTTNPVGLTGVSITYDGLATLPTAAGTYAVVASLNNANYTAANVTAGLVIGKGTATLTLGGLTQTYDGTAKSATVTTNPAGLSGVSITYDGSVTLPTAAGTYAVVASLSNADYIAADATGSLVIGKGTATLTLSGLIATYDGTGKSATVTTNPVGLSGVSITYDGLSTLPTAAGTYAVVVSLTNANYTAADATGSLVIGKGTATLALNNLSQTYDGTGKSATVTTNPVGLSGVSITYDGSATLPTVAGTYAVVASLSNANYTAADATGSLVIGKGTATLALSNLSQTYDGTGKSATVTTNPVGLSGVSITYDGSATLPTAAGTYAVVASLNNANYTALDATGSLVIGKGTATLALSNLSQTYDGIGKTATATTSPAGLSGISITYDGSAILPTAAGTYAVVASLNNVNYTATNATGSLIIGKGTATITLNNLSQTYDGTAKSATAVTNPSGLSGVTFTYNGSATLPILAGTYTVVASLTNSNYTATNATGSLVIGKAVATLALSNLSQSYDGTAKTITVTTNPANLMGVTVTYNGGNVPPTSAGAHTVEASLVNANYTATNVTGILTIGNINQTISFAALADKLSTDPVFTLNATASSGLIVTYSSSDPTIARIINGNQVELLKAGTVSITASQAGNVNYAAAVPITQSLKIVDNPAPVITIVSDKGNSINKGETAILTASGAVSYQWSAANGMITGQNTAILTVRPSVTTTYTVIGTNQYGRSSTQTIKIEVVESLMAVNSTNLITPNGDGINDYWLVNNIDMFPNHSIKIFDRAGRLLLLLRDYKNDWDGRVNGAALEEATYYYLIDFGNGKEFKKGYITIVRNQ
ncbi:MBG domain-containing protein [Pedobacter hiemivivus]|uniref:T9SS type B sorting domain-containing protein n=1 Tax=Pedobacter hiemivivus TaxID=2530454 RepID=A0A4R0MVB7_9SPHI|nr:MBG domain-containing protein [Pedobacter hiemivivus]TCC91080.1 T9SS type B sorting domain-containing protein [Pedobacter hiemivivus]